MGRRKMGRDIHGWLVVDKPAGPTSNDVVGAVRRAFDAKKAGHAGTLDPAATGILAVALGEATKTVPYVTDALKAYRFTVRWGLATRTDDAEGAITDRSDLRPDDAAIAAELPRYTGDIMQVPPAFSAVKVDGERAYALARGGADPDLAPRPLFVESLALVDRPDADHAVFDMVCGKGGYVRAIARDLGRDLGCHGHVVTLRRIWSGPFDEAHAVPLSRIAEMAGDPALLDLLLPLETGLADLPQVRCLEPAAARLTNGNPAEVIASEAGFGDTAWASCRGVPVAIGDYRAGMLHPVRVFRL